MGDSQWQRPIGLIGSLTRRLLAAPGESRRASAETSACVGGSVAAPASVARRQPGVRRVRLQPPGCARSGRRRQRGASARAPSSCTTPWRRRPWASSIRVFARSAADPLAPEGRQTAERVAEADACRGALSAASHRCGRRLRAWMTCLPAPLRLVGARCEHPPTRSGRSREAHRQLRASPSQFPWVTNPRGLARAAPRGRSASFGWRR